MFWPALWGTWVLDDQDLVAGNAALRHSDFACMLTQPLFGITHGFWRPLSALLMWIGHSLGGPFGIHLLALSLHAANALTVQVLAHRLLGDASRAFWVALLFAVHPVQVESVSWCSSINDPLWVACALQCTLAALRWRDRGAGGAPWAATAWCFAALLAKETAVTSLPLVLAALLWVPPAAGRAPPHAPWNRVVLAFLGACLLWAAVRAIALDEGLGSVLLAEPGRPLSTVRFLTAPFDLLLRHLTLLVQPFPITPFRTLPEHVSAVRLATLLVAITALIAALQYGWHRIAGSTGFASVVLLVPLLPPVLCFRSVGLYPIADRYLYLPVFGFALLAAHVAGAKWSRWLLLAAVLACAPVSFGQTSIWRSQERFVEHALALRTDDPSFEVMAGDLALEEAQAGSAAALLAARTYYEAAVTGTVVVPEQRYVPRSLSAGLLGLAWCMLLEQQGRRGPDTPALLDAFQRAIDAGQENPAAWIGFGVANAIAERYPDAERALRKALAIDGSRSEAWFNLGLLQVRTNREREAVASLRQALWCQPDNSAARELLVQIEKPSSCRVASRTARSR
ncbi:MAG TPA: hypothetical protein VF384_15590 [Planctomycetota bacterium]